MKLILIFALICGSALAAPQPSKVATTALKSLIDDLLDFVALIPIDELKEITEAHGKNDAEFCEVVKYLQGDEWAALVAEVAAKQEVKDFEQYLNEAGLPVDVIISLVHGLIQDFKCTATSAYSKPNLTSLRGYLDEIEAALPVDELKALLDDKMQNSADFKALYAKISSDKAHTLVEEVRALPEVQRIAQKLKDLGVRVDEALAKVYEWLGWGAPIKALRSLIDDLLDFVALIPIDKLKEITETHGKNDAEFCEVVKYLQGDEWAALVAEVAAKQEVKDFEQYLNEAGLPVDLIISLVHGLIQDFKCTATSAYSKPNLTSLRGYLDEIEAALPVDELKALLDDKMQNSADFKALYAKISSDKAHTLVEEVRALPEVQRIAQKLKDLGVRVDEALAKVYEWLGWGAPIKALRSLIDDLLDFVALIPIDKLKEITETHGKNDAEFCEVVKYLQGDEWAALVAEVAAKQEVKDFEQYLNEAGLPVDLIISLVHGLIQDFKCTATSAYSKPNLTSLRGYLDEIEAALPVDELKALLDDKMQNSADFKALYAKISSDKAHTLVEEVRALPEVQRIAQKLKDLGVRVDEALAKVYEWLGWGAPIKALRSLIDDLLDFVALIPIDKLKEITETHGKNDAEFCEVVKYLQGDEWAALVAEVAAKQEVKDFEQYLNEAGLPVDLIISLVHGLIQDFKCTATSAYSKPNLTSLRGYLDEIEAALPVDELKALLDDKMQNSADFKALYAKISSDKAHTLVEEVRALPEVQRIAQKLKDLGVRVDEALAKVYEWLGWGAPIKALRSLIDDLLDFVALIPIDKLKEITETHGKNDAEFCEVVKYLQGDEWAALVAEVAAKQEVKDFEQYLNEAGLPVDLIISLVHGLIQDFKCTATSAYSKPNLTSLRGYLDEIEAALPVDELKALLDDKMQNSADFKALYAKISSDKAHTLVEEVRALPEVQRIAQKLKDLGVRVDEALAKVYEWLGWGAPIKALRSLIDDLLDFVALIPIDKLKEITEEHGKNDAEFCEVVKYLQGDEWAALVAEVAAKQEVKDFEQYLNDAGLPVDLIISLVHGLIQDFKCTATSAYSKPNLTSLRGYLDEIEAALPVDELKALLDDKMQNSADFKALYAKISSDKAHTLVEEVRALPEVQRIAQKLKDLGVRVDEALAIVYEWLGWGAPKKSIRFA